MGIEKYPPIFLISHSIGKLVSIEKYLPIFDSIGKLVGIEKKFLYLSENQVWYVTMRMASLCLGGIINTDFIPQNLGPM